MLFNSHNAIHNKRADSVDQQGLFYTVGKIGLEVKPFEVSQSTIIVLLFLAQKKVQESTISLKEEENRSSMKKATAEDMNTNFQLQEPNIKTEKTKCKIIRTESKDYLPGRFYSFFFVYFFIGLKFLTVL